MEMNTEEKEISLIDLLLATVENLKLLIVGPIVAGLLALGLSYGLPQTHTSQATLSLPTPTPTPTSKPTPTPTQAAAMMVSPSVLDPVVTSLNLFGAVPIELARTLLAQQVKVTVGKDGLLRLDVSASTASQAQITANSIIDVWLKSTVPTGEDRKELEVRLAFAESSLASVRLLSNRLISEGASDLGKPLTRGEAGGSIIAAADLQARYWSEVLSLQRSLQGLSREVIVQPATLAYQSGRLKKRGLIVAMAVLSCFLILLLWIFIRQAWSNASLDPVVAKKQARLRSAFGFNNRLH